MTSARRFQQVDVFTTQALRGNALAIVLDGDGLGDAQMAALARWTNLSETTFLLPPTDDGADYRVRIFTPTTELPFAGHPTLGSCHAWLAAGGVPRHAGHVVQQCGVGLVRIRATRRHRARDWPSRRRRAGAAGRSTRRRSNASRAFSACRAAPSWRTSTATTGRPGWR
jgi:PhzF family phenazine biosynthesis protein